MFNSNFRILAESTHFVVGHVFEEALIIRKEDGREFPAGDHYGDPSVALIAPDESWFLVGGEGLTFFDTRVGVLEFLRPRPTDGESEVTVRYESADGQVSSFEAVVRRTYEPIFVDRLELLESGKVFVHGPDEPAAAWIFNPAECSCRSASTTA
jgi:hypothetical protein